MSKPVLGLIGSIGSGKSLVAEMLAARGARVISGDEAGHEALRQPDIRDRIVQRWGEGVLAPDGAIDRRKLGALVFAVPEERQALEALVFPFIRRRLEEQIAQAQQDEDVRLVVLDAAVLLEAGWDDCCDRIVFVDAARVLRLERVGRQRGWSDAELASRERAQWPLPRKAARADIVIENSGSPDALARRLEQFLENVHKHPGDAGSSNHGRNKKPS